MRYDDSNSSKLTTAEDSPWALLRWSRRPPQQCSHITYQENNHKQCWTWKILKVINPKPIPELFFDSGIARGINPCLAPGEIIDSPVTYKSIRKINLIKLSKSFLEGRNSKHAYMHRTIWYTKIQNNVNHMFKYMEKIQIHDYSKVDTP